jgi:hypothetical protein
VDPLDRVFPDVLAGGGWETLLTFVNLSSAPARFTLTFYDDNGNAVNMPLTNPDGSVSRFAAVDFSMGGYTSQELVVADVDNNANLAWAYLSFPGDPAPIAGLAVVAQDANGNEIVRDAFLLAPGARATISLPDAYNILAGTSGKLRVTRDTSQLSANRAHHA